ncbi:MAG: transglycosylase SLT domain-containing protein [Pseudomonadota bacterium]
MNEKSKAPTLNRRKFLLTFGMGSAATIVMYKVIKPSKIFLGENSTLSAEHIKWKPSEYVHNWEKTLQTLFQLQSNGDPAELIFVDQNGNIIDHKVISTKDEIKDAKGVVIPAWAADKKRFNQKWLNAWRRKFHRRYPSIDFDLTLDQERPKQMNTKRSVRNTNYKTNIELILNYGTQKVSGLEDGLVISRIAYAEKVFSQSTQVGEQQAIELPVGIRKRLSQISYGIAGIESGFNNSLISPVKAQSVWQIMPSTFAQICKKIDLKANYGNFITTTVVAKRYCEEIYAYLLRNCHDDFESLRTEFGFSKTDFENEFIFPCIVSAYHAGYGRLRKVIHWFAENYNQDRLRKKIGTYPDGYGYDLFGQMTRICYHDKSVKGYGRESWEYFLRANAMAALIRQKYGIGSNAAKKEYHPPEVLLPPFNLRREAIDLGVSAAAGLATMKLSELIFRPNFVKMSLLALGSLLIVGCFFMIDKPQPVSEPPKKLISEPPKKPVPEQHFTYSKELGKELSAHPQLFSKNPGSQYYKVKMPRRIQAKVITPWMTKHELFKAFYLNRAAVQKAAKTQELIQLSYSGNLYYRCRTVGSIQLQKDKAKGINTKSLGTQNHPDYLYIKPSTEKLVAKISELVNKELQGKFGLDPQYRIRLIVNSGIRDTLYNLSIRGSSLNSTHQLGMAVDFSTHGFDVIKPKSNTFLYLSRDKGKSIDKKPRIRDKARQALKYVLVKLHKAGEIFAIKEGGHYHVTDKGRMK